MRALCLLLVLAGAVLGYAAAANLRESCSLDSDCAGIAHAKCLDRKCACEDDYMPNVNGTLCHHKSEAYNMSCIDTAECQKVLGLKGSCQRNFLTNDTTTRCLCIVGNHFDSQSYTCRRNLQLNDKCSGDVDGACYLLLDGSNQHVRCASNGTCACEDGYVPDYVSQKCSIYKPCTSDGDCAQFVNAECATSGSCACKAGYGAITDVGTQGVRRIYCGRGLRSACIAPTDCVTNAECRDGVCACVRDYLPSANGARCHHKAEAYNASCELNADCSEAMGTLSLCDVATPTTTQAATPTGRCVCDPSAHYYNYTCHRSLAFGSRCSDDTWGRCYMAGDGDFQRTACAANGTCACAEGYAPSADLMHCSSSTLNWLAPGSILLALLAWTMA